MNRLLNIFLVLSLALSWTAVVVAPSGVLAQEPEGEAPNEVEGSVEGDGELEEAPVESEIPAPPPADVPAPPPADGTDAPTPEGTTPPPPELPAAVGDDETYPEADPVRRLDGWLSLIEERTRTGRLALAVLSLITGAVTSGFSVWAFSQDDETLRPSLGGMFILLGVFQLTLGVAMLHVTFPQEDRFVRWRAITERGATSEDVAGFAGEFRMEADLARFQRTLGAITGFSMAAGGAAALILSATVPTDDLGRVITVAYGSAFLVIGGLTGILSLIIETPIERDWERYERGLTPRPDAEPTLGVSPFVGDHFAGLGAHGTF